MAGSRTPNNNLPTDAKSSVLAITPQVTQAIQSNTSTAIIRTLRSSAGIEIDIKRLANGGHEVTIKPPARAERKYLRTTKEEVETAFTENVGGLLVSLAPYDKPTVLSFLFKEFDATRKPIGESSILNVSISPKNNSQ